MRIRILSLAALVGLMAGANTLPAQQHHKPDKPAAADQQARHGMPRMMDGHGMMGRMGPQAAMLLGQREALELSDEQVERLEALKADAAAGRERHMANMKPLAQQIAAVAGEAQPDMGRLESLLEDQAQAHVQMQLGMARMSREAMSVLTEEQRSNVRYGMRLMHGMKKGMMQRRSEHGADDDGDDDDS